MARRIVTLSLVAMLSALGCSDDRPISAIPSGIVEEKEMDYNKDGILDWYRRYDDGTEVIFIAYKTEEGNIGYRKGEVISTETEE